MREYLKHYPIKTIYLHLDNDEWGRKQTKNLFQYYQDQYEIWDESPFKGYKDFNEQLVSLKGDSRR